jgi:hypothetical protein
LDFINEQRLAYYDTLCLMDFDEVNACKIASEGFSAALEFLFSSRENAGVFAVSDPVYYDIYALRHEHWSPGDCWKAFRAARVERRAAVFQTLVCDRQVPIGKNEAPILVDSAFGGLALYRLSYALKASYVGIDDDGEETCEHVSFNKDIGRAGGKLYIFPRLRNSTPWGHCLNGRAQKTIRLSNSALQMELVAPQSHQLDHYLSSYPSYGRRLPLLLTVFNRVVGGASVLTIGPEILDTVALMRLCGVNLPKAICVDACLEVYKYAEINAAKNPALGETAEIVWGFVGAGEDRGNTVRVNGIGNFDELQRYGQLQSLLEPRHVTFDDLAPSGLDLIKADLEGYDHVVIHQNLAWLDRWKPMLWLEVHIKDGDDISVRRDNLLALAEGFYYVAVFDKCGLCLCAGEMTEKCNTLLELIGIGCRYGSNETGANETKFYRFDFLFVPQHLAEVFQDFVRALPEISTAQATVSVSDHMDWVSLSVSTNDTSLPPLRNLFLRQFILFGRCLRNALCSAGRRIEKRLG